MRYKRYLLLVIFGFVFLLANTVIYAAHYNPEAARTNAVLGLLLLNKGNVIESKLRLIAALKEDPLIAPPWYSMAYFLEKTGDLQNAKRYYLFAIRLEPNSGEAKNNYGAFLCRTHHYQAAVEAFLAAVQNPNYLYTAQAYKNAAICAKRIPDKRLANRYFKKAAEYRLGR